MSRIILLFLFLSLSIVGVAQAAFPDAQAVPGIVAPVRLGRDTTRLLLTDYIQRVQDIDSVSLSRGLLWDWSRKTNVLTIVAQPTLAPLAELKLWSKGFAYSIVLKRAIRNTQGPIENKPVIHSSRLGKGSFTVSISFKRFPFSVAFYWQNFRLGKGFIKRAGEEMLVTIPVEAQKIPRSYLRVYANDEEDVSNEILLPLQNGEVVNDPGLLGKDATQPDVAGVRSKAMISPQLDPILALVSDQPLDIVAAKIQQGMELYGSHHILSGYQLDTGLRLSFTNDKAYNGWATQPLSTKARQDKMAMLLALATAFPGSGIDSAGLKYSSPVDKHLTATITTMARLRTTYLALLYGETEVYAKTDIMIIRRSYFSQIVLFVFNGSKEKQLIETGIPLTGFKATFGHTATGSKVELPPMSFEAFAK